MYACVPHQSLVIVIKANSPTDDVFIILDGCKQLRVPCNWKIGSLSASRVDANTIVLRDELADVSVTAYAARLLPREDAENYARDRPELLSLIKSS